MCDEQATNPVLGVPLPLWLGGGREFESEVQPWKKGGVTVKCLKIWFYFSLSCSNLIGNK